MTSQLRVATPPSKPLLLFDGDCNFCQHWIARWRVATGDRIDYRPYQDPLLRSQFPEIPTAACENAVQLIETNGDVYSGAAAVFRIRGWSWLYKIPGCSAVSEFAYRVVAQNRTLFSTLTRWLWGNHAEVPSNILTRWVFLRLLGLIFLIAFLSLNVQVDGLIGSHGIQPAADLMRNARAIAQTHDGQNLHWLLPTLCWLNANDGFLHFLCYAGAALSVLLIGGIVPPLTLALLTLFYLSLVTVGDVFLGFQWDALLIETGFLAIWLAPWQWGPRRLSRETEPPRLALWMMRWLLFRLMLLSGIVKLASGDTLWRNLKALTVHYETQPLPAPLAWYAHQLPVGFQRVSCAGVFLIELGLPWLIFAPRRVRFVAAGGFMFLMGLIALTGNYCFFNLLAVALCILMLDDTALRRHTPAEGLQRAGRWRSWLVVPVAAMVLWVSVPQLLRSSGVVVDLPGAEIVAPLRIVNSYGLFAVMTPTRPEIVIEGSNDGQTWLPYEFRYKPGDVRQRPRYVAPYQPRLDWQMWFAALGDYRSNPWFMNFCVRLLQGQPEVVALLEDNPFPNRPPQYLRAVVYQYNFTNPAKRAADGSWWRREVKGLYCPVLSLKQNP